MTKLAGLLGNQYEERRKNLRIKHFELGGHLFKVRIPLVAESDEIYKRIAEPDANKVDAIYKTMADPLQKFKDEATDSGFEFLENDVLINGKSLREAARSKAMLEQKIVEFIKLLVPENGTLDDITFEDIEAEWPTSVQIQMVEKIGEIISPTYKEVRGN